MIVRPAAPGSVATLLTDFGLADPYVGAMKGVMLGINPKLTLVDLTHEVPPQDVFEGAFQLGQAWRYFPAGTVHVAVVDPGVGTQRKALLLLAHGHLFLAPDNGLLTFVLPPQETEPPLFRAYVTRVPPELQAYALTNPAYWRHPVSNTFHGRDIFAPVAAHLSLGIAADEVGTSVAEITRLALPVPRWKGDGLLAYVLHVDRFGNIVTSVPHEVLADCKGEIEVLVGGANVSGLARTYAEAKGLAALIGSHGYLEVALANGNAAAELGVGVGDEVKVRKG